MGWPMKRSKGSVSAVGSCSPSPTVQIRTCCRLFSSQKLPMQYRQRQFLVVFNRDSFRFLGKLRMDSRPTPFPAKKTKPLKPKPAWRTNSREPLVSRQKRVFGTVRSTNIVDKKVTDKPKAEISTDVPKKQPKPTQTLTTTAATANNLGLSPTNEVVAKHTSPEKSVAARTPVASPFAVKGKVSSTPYHSARYCSKCRFDRLETASYWLGQIKLAESAGKHFVSAAFFRLAFDSNAEPLRNLSVELKRYLARHGYLSTQKDWKHVSLTYGILKDENAAGQRDEIASEPKNWDLGQDEEGVEEQQLEQPEIK